MGTRDRWQALIVQVTAHLALVLYPRELRQGIVVAIVNLLTAVQVLNVPRVLQVRARPVMSLVILRAEIRKELSKIVTFELTPLPLAPPLRALLWY